MLLIWFCEKGRQSYVVASRSLLDRVHVFQHTLVKDDLHGKPFQSIYLKKNIQNEPLSLNKAEINNSGVLRDFYILT